jgi:hypothetical protein
MLHQALVNAIEEFLKNEKRGSYLLFTNALAIPSVANASAPKALANALPPPAHAFTLPPPAHTASTLIVVTGTINTIALKIIIAPITRRFLCIDLL